MLGANFLFCLDKKGKEEKPTTLFYPTPLRVFDRSEYQ